MLHPSVTRLAEKNMTARRITDQAAAARHPGPPRRGPVNLAQAARRLQADLAAHHRPGITDANALDVQARCVAEEAGELVGAYRRYAGRARRTGTRRELEDEIADVLLVTAVFADRAGIDIDAAVAAKLAVIYSRGWQDPPPAA